MKKKDIIIGAQASLNDYQKCSWFKEHKQKVKPVFDSEERFDYYYTQGTFGILVKNMIKRLYIVIRGSNEHGDWYGEQGNFEFKKVTIDNVEIYNSKPLVHLGARRAWSDLVMHCHAKIKKEKPDEIWIVTHSRGGLIGAQGAENLAYYYSPEIPIYSIYLSSPRPGNRDFQKLHDNRVTKSVMIYLIGDIVCCVPPWLAGYRAIGNTVGLWKWTWPPIAGAHYPFNVLTAIQKSNKLTY